MTGPLLRSSGAVATPEPGVFSLPALFATLLARADELPAAAPDTLWLRLVGGSESVRRSAMEELRRLPREASLSQPVMDALVRWRAMLQARRGRWTRLEKELLMDVETIYQKWRSEAIEEGRDEALLGARRTYLRYLQLRFPEMPPEVATKFLSAVPAEAALAILELAYAATDLDELRIGLDRILSS